MCCRYLFHIYIYEKQSWQRDHWILKYLERSMEKYTKQAIFLGETLLQE